MTAHIASLTRIALGAFTLSLCSSVAAASPARVTEAEIDAFGVPVKVVRARTPGKTAAVFEAEPEALSADAVAVVEIRSVGKYGATKRYYCVAVDDVSECLGQPVRVPYLDDDDAVVLSVELAPADAVRETMHLAVQ